MASLDWWVLLVAALTGCCAGALIGMVGVGGIIIVPVLIQLPGISTKTAIASAMFSYMFVGIGGSIAFARNGSINWPSTAWMGLGSLVAAFLGSFTLTYFPEDVLKTVLYGFMLFSSIIAVCKSLSKENKEEGEGVGEEELHEGQQSSMEPNERDEVPPLGSSGWDRLSVDTFIGRLSRVAIGAVAGFGSALTGTSGPVVLLPILLLLRWDVMESLGSAQVLQVPIALAATVANICLPEMESYIDFELGSCIAAGLTPCAFIGAYLAHKIKPQRLTLIVALTLVTAALALLTKEIVTNNSSS